MNEDWIHVKSFYHYGGKKPLCITKWILVDAPKKTNDGMMVRTIMSPRGWMYRDYYGEDGPHELQVIYHPPIKKRLKKIDYDDID